MACSLSFVPSPGRAIHRRAEVRCSEAIRGIQLFHLHQTMPSDCCNTLEDTQVSLPRNPCLRQWTANAHRTASPRPLLAAKGSPVRPCCIGELRSVPFSAKPPPSPAGANQAPSQPAFVSLETGCSACRMNKLVACRQFSPVLCCV